MAKKEMKVAANTEAVVIAPKTVSYVRTRAVAVPSLSMKNLTHLLFVSHGEIVEGEIIGDEAKPANIMRIVALESGEMFNLIMPTVLESILRRKYTGVGEAGLPEYVGMAFEVVKSRREGKKYDDYAVYEISVEAVEREDVLKTGFLAEQAG